MSIRREIHRRGMRFTVNRRDLPGSSDVLLSRARIALFVDGCFGHMWPEHHIIPKNNRSWWLEKLEGNVERDRRKDKALVEMGWLPMHFWEHEDVMGVAETIDRGWRLRTGRTH